LLGKAEAEFDVLVTTDRNLRRQQNLAGLRSAVHGRRRCITLLSNV